MRTFSKYLVREFFKLFFLCLVAFLAVFMMIDFLQKIDNLIEAGVAREVMLAYFLYKIPFVIVQMLPAASLISVIIMFSLLKRRNEIVALKACGLHLMSVAQPVIVLSILLGAFQFFISEVVVPVASARSNRIWTVQVEKQDPERHYYGRDQIWYKGNDAIYMIEHFNRDEEVMQRPTFYFFDESFRLKRRIGGLRGVWEEGKWKIQKGIIQERDRDGSFQIRRFEEMALEIPETPETFVRGFQSPEEMNYWQLKRYAERVRLEGYDNTRYLVDMYLRTAFPLVILIMTLIGVPLALEVEKGGTPLAISLGIAVCFLYVLVLGIARSLGLSGVLPPVLSAWLANMIFSLVGIYAVQHVQK